jgi:hypothetical protein
MEVLSKVDPEVAAATFPNIIREESYILITATKPNAEELTFTTRFGGELFVDKNNNPKSARMVELLTRVKESILES